MQRAGLWTAVLIRRIRSVGAFFILPLLDAYEITGKKVYLDTALKAFRFYYEEFSQSGVTTAAALVTVFVLTRNLPRLFSVRL